MAQLKALLKSREALYEQAPLQLDTSGISLDQSLSRLLQIIAGNDLI